MRLLASLGLTRHHHSMSTPALPVTAQPPPPTWKEVGSAPATPATHQHQQPHLKRTSCTLVASSAPSFTTTTTSTSTRDDVEWCANDDNEEAAAAAGMAAEAVEEEEDVLAGYLTPQAEEGEKRGGEAEERRPAEKGQRRRERREQRERQREEKKEMKKRDHHQQQVNNRGRWGWVREEREEDAEQRARREAEEEDEEDMRVLLAASHLQGETRNESAFACSGRSQKDDSKKKNKQKRNELAGEKKSRKERKLEKRENKKDKKQRKIDKELQREREKQEKRRSRNRGHARSSSDVVPTLAGGAGQDGAGLPSSASTSMLATATSSQTAVATKPKRSWRHTWRMSGITCLGRTPSMDEEDLRSQESRRDSTSSRDGPAAAVGRKSSKLDKGKDKHHEEDDDPDKKSGPGKVFEEGTVEPCGEDGEEEGWSEESVEWCGVKYASDDLPPFDTSGLRGKTAYNPNHCIWLATAAALAYRSPAQIRHVVTRIWDWEGMEFFHNAETDTQGFGMYGKDCIVICFRGTESSRDWSTNIKISETEPFPDLPGVKVHNGFNRALTSVLEEVVDFIGKALSSNPSLPLYITGHSLGGALANLCLAYFTFPSSPFLLKTAPCPATSSSSSSSSDPDEQHVMVKSHRETLIKGVYTFGQPKVGNDQFAYQLRVHSAGTVFFRLTNNNDLVPFVPRRLYVHCGTRIFLSGAGHIVQGDEAARPAREFWRENNHGRMFKRKRQGLRDHLVKSYVTFLREHYRINEAILLSPLRKDMPLLRFHDMERAKLSCEEMRKLVSFDSVIEGLKHMTVSDLMDTKSLTMTAKQRKREAQTLGRKWLREQLWEKLKDNEEQQIKKVYKLLKNEVEKKKAKHRGDNSSPTKLHGEGEVKDEDEDLETRQPQEGEKQKRSKMMKDGPLGALFASFASFASLKEPVGSESTT